jgi:hypothetical protein
VARKRHLFQEGTLSANLGGALTDTTMQSAELASLPVVLAPDTLTIVLDPEGAGGTPEVVVVTDHASGSTSATITRQQEVGSGGSAVRSHAINTKWVHAITPLDHDHGNLDGLGDDDHPQYVNRSTAQPDINGDKGFLGRMGVGRVVSSVVHFIAQSPLDTRVAGGFQRASAAATADLVQFYSETGGVMAGIDASGRFHAATGSVGVPGLSFHADADTGFYRSAADQVSLANGGVEKFRFGATGNLWAAGSIAHFGTNALGASGASVGIGDFGDPSTIYYRAFGTTATINHVIRPKGTNGRLTVQAEAGGTNVLDVNTTTQVVQANGDLKVGNQSVPRGVLGYAEVTTSQNGITSETALTGMSVTVTADASRRIRVSWRLFLFKQTVDDTVLVSLHEGTTRLQEGGRSVRANWWDLVTDEVILTPASGSHTYKVHMTGGEGGGSVDLVASSTRRAFILVEDIGAA